MADNPISCRVCGIELADVPASPAAWPITSCPACGEVAVVCRGQVLCSACGIEYPCETAWLEGKVPVAKCPTCGSTAAIRRPDPPPPLPPPPTEAKPEEEPPPVRREEEPAPPPDWSSLPWPPAPWPAPAPRPSADTVAALWAAERVTGMVILIFVVACFLPSFRLGGNDYQPGIFGLLCGWITCIFWLPNPLLFFGCRGLLSGHFRYAFTLGVLACIGSLPAFAVRGMLENLSWGFYVWQGDIVFFTISAAVLWRRHGESVGEPPRRR